MFRRASGSPPDAVFVKQRGVGVVAAKRYQRGANEALRVVAPSTEYGSGDKKRQNGVEVQFLISLPLCGAQVITLSVLW